MHGTRWPAIYSILFHELLFASDDESKGGEGVYCFPVEFAVGGKGDQEVHEAKSHFYLQYVDLLGDGIFSSIMIEMLVDLSKKLKPEKAKTDQWIIPAEYCEIQALWIHCVNLKYSEEKPGK